MGSSFVFKGVMNLIESKFSLELTKGGVQRVVFAKSGERGSRVVLITLTEAGKVFDASPYRLRVNFDSGESVSSTVTFEQGCVRFEIPEGALVTPGEKLCELQISNDTRLIYAPVFKIVVEQSIGQQNTEDIQFNESVHYQESIPNLNVGKNVTLNDEVALFDGEDTTRNKLSALPFVTDEAFDEHIESQAEVNKIVGANAVARHTHDNKEAVLDKLGVDGGKLTFDNNLVAEGELPADISALTMVAMLASESAHASIESPEDAEKTNSKFRRAIRLISQHDAYYAPSLSGVLNFRDAFGLNDYTIDVECGKAYRLALEGSKISTYEVSSIEEVELLIDTWVAFVVRTSDSGEGLTPQQKSDLEANTLARHTHSNKAVLDNFDVDSKGNLLFNNKPVASGSTPSIKQVDASIAKGEAYLYARDDVLVFETSMLPENARVKKIEFPDVANGTGELIQIEDMISKDANGIGCPYFVMYPKNMMGEILTTVAAVVCFTTYGNTYFDLVASYMFGDVNIKIYYEIEE